MKYIIGKFVMIAVWLFTFAIWISIRISGWLMKKRPRKIGKSLTILLTGRFYSQNWIDCHLRPLAASSRVKLVIMVSNEVVPEMPGVYAHAPSERSVRYLGETTARLLAFSRIAFQRDVDVIGGFHLLLNGLLAQLWANCLGRESLYICGGGLREFEGGGVYSDNRIYNKIGSSSNSIEQLLRSLAMSFDLIVTMGTGVRDYLVSQGSRSLVAVNPGGFDEHKYFPKRSTKKDYDLIFIGRLSPVKRVHVLLDAIQECKEQGLVLRLVIVGDGPSKRDLMAKICDRGLEGEVSCVGWQTNVENWLARSKVFVLASASEGVSQAMIQAMMCGLPAIVPNVGDLSDVVMDGRNGRLLDSTEVQDYVDALRHMFADDNVVEEYSMHACRDTASFTIEGASHKWTTVFDTLDSRQRSDG